MKHCYLCLLGLALAGPVRAQAPADPPPPPLSTSFKNGSYLATDVDDWQPAKLRYTAAPELQVQDATHKADAPLVLLPGQLRSFVLGRDTFDVVRNFAVPVPAQQLPLAFARRLYRAGGFQVAEYVAYRFKPEVPVGYRLLLDQPGGRVLAVLPLEPRLFRMALAAAVRDYRPLADQLELDPRVLPVQLPELLAAYGRWKRTQPAAATGK